MYGQPSLTKGIASNQRTGNTAKPMAQACTSESKGWVKLELNSGPSEEVASSERLS
ncbi:hypothetical protein PGT21_021593 [Puccinia graminis f. sp. tritici]|nr:hypothetical protein PGT21_021593 [Puccinia graminis f. sp. tritici]KAA1134851.1 hypothetical protein PGTUg99_004391 [Puccinia graminis f. sp. tritici]